MKAVAVLCAIFAVAVCEHVSNEAVNECLTERCEKYYKKIDSMVSTVIDMATKENLEQVDKIKNLQEQIRKVHEQFVQDVKDKKIHVLNFFENIVDYASTLEVEVLDISEMTKSQSNTIAKFIESQGLELMFEEEFKTLKECRSIFWKH